MDRHRHESVWFMPFAASCLIILAVAQAAALTLDHDMPALVAGYTREALGLPPAMLLLWSAVRLGGLIARRDPAPFRTIASAAVRVAGEPGSLVARCGVLLLLPPTMAALAMLKMLLPALTGGFTADAALTRIDSLLFLGHQPWQLTHALLGAQLSTMAIDRLYTLWVPLLAIATGWAALFATPADRARFFLTFLGCWALLGTVGAYLGASAGPCFQAMAGAPDAHAFTGLADRLMAIDATVGLNALEWQRVLWHAHTTGRMDVAMGISAMPSMHVSIATLYVLLARRHGPVAQAIALAFAAATLIGSVHLGWHYAADGLVSIVGTMVIYRAADRWLARRERDVGTGSPVIASAAV